MREGSAKIAHESLSFDQVHELKEAKDHFETIWQAKAGLKQHLSQTGEPYVVVVPGGIKEQGRPFPLWCSTVETAVKLWRKAIYDYADGEEGRLYWRVEPSLCVCSIRHKAEKGEDEPTRLYTIYSRLLISDWPEIQQAKELA